MTVTMTIEEFDELREAKQKLEEVKDLLSLNVYYTAEARDYSSSKAWMFAKSLPWKDVALLLTLLGVYPNPENIDEPEETEE